MRLPSYPAYKVSGVEWAGELPRHWDVRPLKRLAVKIDQKVEPDSDGPLPYVGLEHVESWTGQLVPLADDQVASGISNRFRSGDTLFGKLRPYLAKACNPTFDGLCSSELLVLRPTHLHPCYLLYSLLTEGFISSVDASTYGAKMPRANWEFIGSCPLPVPPPAEQAVIARFLDRETARIDALVVKKREVIERLNEKRSALISRTITRGLPPDAARAAGLDPRPKLKPSGVAWLGEVPRHWTVEQLKWAVTFQRGHDLPADHRDEGNVPVVTSSGVSGTHSSAIARGPGIVTGRYGTIGQFYLVAEDYWPLNTTLYSIDLRGNDPGFLVALLSHLSPLFVLNAVKSAVPGVDRNDIHSIVVAVPPRAEQSTIARFLSDETSKVDRLTSRIEAAIERLTEYRAALITAAVTGKIDVRGLVAPDAPDGSTLPS